MTEPRTEKTPSISSIKLMKKTFCSLWRTNRPKPPLVAVLKMRCRSNHTDCPVCSVNMSECAGKEVEPELEETEQPEPEEDKGGGMGGAILLVVLLLAAAGGGAFYYFKIMKPEKGRGKRQQQP